MSSYKTLVLKNGTITQLPSGDHVGNPFLGSPGDGDSLVWDAAQSAWVSIAGTDLKSLLSLVVGEDLQVYSANLDTLSGVASSVLGRTLLSVADAATARTALGLGSAALGSLSSLAITGGTIVLPNSINTTSNRLYDSSANVAYAWTGRVGYDTTGAPVFEHPANFFLYDGKHLATGTVSGSKIGSTTTQKLGFWGSTPVVKQAGDIVDALALIGLVAGGFIDASDIQGSITASVLGSGSADDTVFLRGDLTWATPPSGGGGGGSGSVESVGLSLPSSVFNITGSPVTDTGTLSGSFKNQTANRVFAGPTTGSAAVPTFRALVSADIPTVDFGSLSGRPTTLSGYGITDAQPLSAALTQYAGLTTTSYGRSLLGLAGATALTATLKVTSLWDTTNNVALVTLGSATVGFDSSLSSVVFNGGSAAAFRTGLGLTTAAQGVASGLTSGVVATARLGTGTANNTTFLRGDGTWAPLRVGVPASPTASGIAGTYAIDTAYFYACPVANTWVRAPLATWTP